MRQIAFFFILILSFTFIYSAPQKKEMTITDVQKELYKDILELESFIMKTRISARASGGNKVATTSYQTNIFAEPKWNSPVVDVATKGETFNWVEGKEGWFKVFYGENKTGWLHQDNVQIVPHLLFLQEVITTSGIKDLTEEYIFAKCGEELLKRLVDFKEKYEKTPIKIKGFSLDIPLFSVGIDFEFAK